MRKFTTSSARPMAAAAPTPTIASIGGAPKVMAGARTGSPSETPGTRIRQRIEERAGRKLSVARFTNPALREELYELTEKLPTFEVQNAQLKCVLCGTLIGFDARKHANGIRHQEQLLTHQGMLNSTPATPCPPSPTPITAMSVEDASAAGDKLRTASTAAKEMKKIRKRALEE